MTAAERQYRLASFEAGRSVLRALGERFIVQEESPRQLVRTYLDTFDWRLHAAGSMLAATSSSGRTTLQLTRAEKPDRLTCLVDTIPAFGEDLPPGRMRDTVAPRTNIRRLLALVSVEVASKPARVLDKRNKTVVRIHLEKRAVRLPGNRQRYLPALLCVSSLRGYRREFEAVCNYLRSVNELGCEGATEQVQALEAVGRLPGDYSSKIRVDLVAESAAAKEIRRIHQVLLDTMIANEDGLRGDLDTEFLHDFRVSVRRTRTALSQIKGVFPVSVLDHFKPEFSWLGKLTGPSRDLDVHQLKMKSYRETLPPAVSGDLEPLERFLRARREVERNNLLRGLDSSRYGRLRTDWREFLTAQPVADATAPRADEPVVSLASREIGRAHRRLLKKGRAIGHETPPEALHRLRIDGKKLRYLLEFFRGLFDPTEMEDLIAALKRLQDNLGDFNDFGVQQEMLATFGRQMLDEGFTSARALMAMGRLVDKLESGKAAERALFARRFAEFDSPKNRRRYKKLV
jgi:CHAD domain-containing protein